MGEILDVKEDEAVLDEDAMANGIALYAAVAERFLDRGFAA